MPSLPEEAIRTRSCDLFAALSNPTRYAIVELLIRGERTVGDVAVAVGIGQSGASQHLAQLARAGLLVAEARGAAKVYRVRGPRVAQILTLTREFCVVHGLSGSAMDEEAARG